MSNQCLCRLCQMSFKSFVYSDNKLFIQIGIKIKSCECSIYIIKLDNEVTSSGFIGKREIKKQLRNLILKTIKTCRMWGKNVLNNLKSCLMNHQRINRIVFESDELVQVNINPLGFVCTCIETIVSCIPVSCVHIVLNKLRPHCTKQI